MDISIWMHEKFQKESKISWPCPNCNNISLTIINDKFTFEETANTKDCKNEIWFETEWIDYIFTGILFCKSCENLTMFSGSGGVESYSYVDETTNEYQCGYNKIFQPHFFQPTLNLFKIAEDCPDTIKEEIINSFKLFWIDLSSCANKVRIALELLMDELNVNKTKTVKKGEIKLNLHERILEYRKENSEVGDFLEAIKWIGNSGSHSGSLEKIDLVETYQLLEFSLNKLYDNKEAELKKIKNEIIARKGKRMR